MKILKYILLLLLLILIASTVFIATLKPDFDIERSKIINAPKSTIYNYVNDYKNYPEFGSWKQDDPSMTFVYAAKTSGKGASYSWKGRDGDGKMQTITTKDNDSIYQKMEYNGSKSEVFWTFKDTLGKTKVTWRNKGKMDFPTKIFSAFLGGIDNLVGNMYERSLANIDKTLDFEINNFEIKLNGYVQKTGGFYLQKTINSNNNDVAKNIQIMIPNIEKFCLDNKIKLNGKPFVIYNSYDDLKKTTNFSVGIPMKEEIFTTVGSEYMAEKLVPFQAVKTTLRGDYSHLKQAKNESLAFIDKNNYVTDASNPYIEVYTKTKTDIKNPSQWITEIYVPVKSKSVVAKTIKPKSIIKTEPTQIIEKQVVEP